MMRAWRPLDELAWYANWLVKSFLDFGICVSHSRFRLILQSAQDCAKFLALWNLTYCI